MKRLDISFDRTEDNKCDPQEVLFSIQAWHEMLNPGHHHIRLFADGSGSVIAAANYPPMYEIPISDRKPLMTFGSLNDFISKTRKALEEKGFEVFDSKKS